VGTINNNIILAVVAVVGADMHRTITVVRLWIRIHPFTLERLLDPFDSFFIEFRIIARMLPGANHIVILLYLFEIFFSLVKFSYHYSGNSASIVKI